MEDGIIIVWAAVVVALFIGYVGSHRAYMDAVRNNNKGE